MTLTDTNDVEYDGEFENDEEEDFERDDYDGFEGGDIVFADPSGRSSLRAESATNPRNLPCGTCGEPDTLTPKDKALGYQCDACADRAEGWGD